MTFSNSIDVVISSQCSSCIWPSPIPLGMHTKILDVLEEYKASCIYYGKEADHSFSLPRCGDQSSGISTVRPFVDSCCGSWFGPTPCWGEVNRGSTSCGGSPLLVEVWLLTPHVLILMVCGLTGDTTHHQRDSENPSKLCDGGVEYCTLRWGELSLCMH